MSDTFKSSNDKPLTFGFLLKAEGYEITKSRLEGSIIHINVEPKWINVKDRLPPFDVQVLATNGNSFGIGYRWVEFDEEVFYAYGYEEISGFNDITHWMPLPKPLDESEEIKK